MNSDFATTQWTLVWKAAEEDSQHGRPALTELMRQYWHPLYAFARRQGLSSEDAEDATQEFLAAILDGKLLEAADPAKGKFRAFLLTAWKRFLVDQYRKGQAQRRGGNHSRLALDLHAGEQQWRALQSREPDADRLFMLSWATSLLAEAQQRLEADYRKKDRMAIFTALVPHLTSNLKADDYQALASEMSMSSSAVKVALHRLRQRFGTTLREVVAETVDEPAEVDAEIKELLQVLSSAR